MPTCCALRPRIVIPFLILFSAAATLGQSSSSYSLEQSVLNAGGRPDDGVSASSGSFSLSLESIGEGLAGELLSSQSFSMAGGFISAFPPPSEVLELRFSDDVTLNWNSERSAGTYNLYRGFLGSLAGLDYGGCLEHGIKGLSHSDGEIPGVPGDGFYYLATAKNRLLEEGSKGWDSEGSERANSDPCP